MANERWTGAGVRPLVATALIGLTAGLMAVAFAASAEWLQRTFLFSGASRSLGVFAITAFGSMTGGALIAGWLMQRFAPDAAGSGIPQVKIAYQRRETDFSWRLIAVKFAGGVLSIGTGSSLGREGPTVHMGAALANKIGRWFHESPGGRLNAVCAGSAAGLAAAFNSPLAGVALVLEEIAGGRDQAKFAGRSLFAAALAVLIVYLMLGNHAALPLRANIPLEWRALWLSPVVALVAGLAGIAFQWSTLRLRGWMKRSPIPPALRPACGAAVGCAAAVAAFALTGRLGVFGLGEGDLLATLQNHLAWSVAGCLLAAKILATTFCYGAGGCGGIFAPLIFFGGMSGTLVFGLAQSAFGLDPDDQTMLSLIGMTACLCSVVRAPITSILIVTEMTQQLQALPALMVAAVIGAFLNHYILGENLYDSALRQDGIEFEE
ncbi:MAG: chloride channel protein [Terrimicrobiaceae bacterium]|nr:chloride channel protein [Terrimicrobiaceae bacterium]